MLESIRRNPSIYMTLCKDGWSKVLMERARKRGERRHFARELSKMCSMNGMLGIGADIGGISAGDFTVAFPTLIFPFSTARIG